MQKKTISRILLIIIPLLIYCIFESVTGNLTEIYGKYLIWNLILFCMIYLLSFSIFGTMSIPYSILNLIFICLATGEYFVTLFRARPVMISDLMSIKTGLSVSGQYGYPVNLHLILCWTAVIVLTVLVWIFPFPIHHGKVHLWTGLGAVTISALCCSIFSYAIKGQKYLEVPVWSPEKSYCKTGYLVSSFAVLCNIIPEKPAEYTQDTFKDIQSKIESEKGEILLPWVTEQSIIPKNIICIMNESWTDFDVIHPAAVSQPYHEFYSSLNENCMKGSLYVPVFGAMTSITEFEFLTGASDAFIPAGTVPYQLFTRNPTYGLVSTLKSQGYQTIAVHPYPAENWNRKTAYRNLGFDRFIAQEAFTHADTMRGYVSDQADFDMIKKLTSEKKAGESLFIFNVTMQNHGGYEMDFTPSVHITNLPNMPKAEQFLSLMRETDTALQQLLEYYEKIEEPTMVVMFGDHQPGIEPEFYEALFGKELNQLTDEEISLRYRTPFLIWTNYDMPSSFSEQVSAHYLSNIILQRANLKMTDYQYYLELLRQNVPVFHTIGYRNLAGEWKDWGNLAGQREAAYFQEYQKLIYNLLFERLDKREDALFMIP